MTTSVSATVEAVSQADSWTAQIIKGKATLLSGKSHLKRLGLVDVCSKREAVCVKRVIKIQRRRQGVYKYWLEIISKADEC